MLVGMFAGVRLPTSESLWASLKRDPLLAAAVLVLVFATKPAFLSLYSLLTSVNLEKHLF